MSKKPNVPTYYLFTVALESVHAEVYRNYQSEERAQRRQTEGSTYATTMYNYVL